MKIDNNNVGGLGLDRSAGAASTARYGVGNPQGSSNSAYGSDEISLSGLSQQLRELSSDSPERQERIQALAAAFAAGTYNVDPMQVSKGIVDDALKGF